MRLPRASPLLLLLAPSLIAADSPQPLLANSQSLSKEAILALNRAPGAPIGRGKSNDAQPIPPNSKSSKPYVGTEDAPVDGLDGKPHAGPFVDRTPDDAKARYGDDPTKTSKSLPTSLENLRPGELQDIPEKNDGVMNDENRPVPKKGTTGTEGGISEKEKARKELDGEVQEATPKGPKQAPVLPHSEEKHIEQTDSKRGTQYSSDEKDSTYATDAKDPITGEKVDPSKRRDSYGDSGYGMEKPDNLPEKPYNIPHPAPRTANDDLGPPVNPEGGKNKWLLTTMDYTEGQTKPKTTKLVADADGNTMTVDDPDHETWHEWVHSFVLSFTMIIFSEIGDKTFLVAALMAMRHARLLVFSAALSALIAMTVLSAVLGHAFPSLLPKKFTTFAAAILFFVFGAKSLKEGLEMEKDAGIGEEMREVEAELEEEEHKMRRRSSRADHMLPYELEGGRGRQMGMDKNRSEPSPPLSRSPSPKGKKGQWSGLVNLCSLVLSPAWVQTFVMTFLGEWGDRSQIATIAMAAGQDYWWVTLGAIVGHAICTGMAVIGGRALAGRVSMRVGELRPDTSIGKLY